MRTHDLSLPLHIYNLAFQCLSKNIGELAKTGPTFLPSCGHVPRFSTVPTTARRRLGGCVASQPLQSFILATVG